jgi:hypothetical protein
MYESHHRSRGSLRIGAFGGTSFPLGSTTNGIDAGWTAGALLDYSAPSLPVGLRLDGSYQHLVPSSATANGAVKLWGGDLDVLLTVPRRLMVRPYLALGAGVYNVNNTITSATGVAPGSSTNFALNGGAGLRYDLLGFGAFLETRYTQVFTKGHDIRLMPVRFGITIGGR